MWQKHQWPWHSTSSWSLLVWSYHMLTSSVIWNSTYMALHVQPNLWILILFITFFAWLINQSMLQYLFFHWNKCFFYIPVKLMVIYQSNQEDRRGTSIWTQAWLLDSHRYLRLNIVKMQPNPWCIIILLIVSITNWPILIVSQHICL